MTERLQLCGLQSRRNLHRCDGDSPFATTAWQQLLYFSNFRQFAEPFRRDRAEVRVFGRHAMPRKTFVTSELRFVEAPQRDSRSLVLSRPVPARPPPRLAGCSERCSMARRSRFIRRRHRHASNAACGGGRRRADGARGAPRPAHGTGLHQPALEPRGTRPLPLRLVRGRPFLLRRQVRIGHRLAELHPAGPARALREFPEKNRFFTRTEISCAGCRSHLGYLFRDVPTRRACATASTAARFRSCRRPAKTPRVSRGGYTCRRPSR